MENGGHRQRRKSLQGTQWCPEYPRDMLMFAHLGQVRLIAVLVALVWLPMSVFAQVCATHAFVVGIGGLQHSGLDAPDDMNSLHASRAGHPDSLSVSLVAVDVGMPALAAADTAMSCQTVDGYESGCDMKSICTFASLAVLVTETQAATIVHDTSLPPIGEMTFSSLSHVPDIPPPRLT